jgi:hypothetical protein
VAEAGVKNMPVIAALKIVREHWCRPCGTPALFPTFPGTYVPGYHIPPLRGWPLDGSCFTALPEIEFARGL